MSIQTVVVKPKTKPMFVVSKPTKIPLESLVASAPAAICSKSETKLILTTGITGTCTTTIGSANL